MLLLRHTGILMAPPFREEQRPGELMKVLKMKNLRQMPDRDKIIAHCVKTVDGLEYAHINMDTGEIRYGSDACIDEKLMREALAGQGIKVEDTQ